MLIYSLIGVSVQSIIYIFVFFFFLTLALSARAALVDLPFGVLLLFPLLCESFLVPLILEVPRRVGDIFVFRSVGF